MANDIVRHFKNLANLLVVFQLFLLVSSCAKTRLLDNQEAQNFSCPESKLKSILADSSEKSRFKSISEMNAGLIATRFKSLEELRTVVNIEYFNEGNESNKKSTVRLVFCNNGFKIVSKLESGISQKDITTARDGSVIDKMLIALNSPFTIRNRLDLKRIYILARVRSIWYGEGDVAFYNIAEEMVNNINTSDTKYINGLDSTEKGYINTFNHITAQAFVTSIFSKEIAGFIADVHERYNMPELTTGKFSQDQLTDPIHNPVDNYVDIINNELGQKLGIYLKFKYQISKNSVWTPKLVSDYLNDLQGFYSWAFQIGFEPFEKEEEIPLKFSRKLNLVMNNDYSGFTMYPREFFSYD